MAGRPSRRLVLSCIPAAAFGIITVILATGATIIPLAGAATTEPVNVTAEVGEVIELQTPNCPAAATGFGAIGTAATALGTDCTMTFNTNRGVGAHILVSENRTADTLPALCRVGGTLATDPTTGACIVGTADDQFTNRGATAGALAQGEFGITLRAVANGARAYNATGCTDCWTEAGVATPLTTGTYWYGVPEDGAAAKACDVTGPTTTASCSFRFAAHRKMTQTAGKYEARVKFVATAN